MENSHTEHILTWNVKGVDSENKSLPKWIASIITGLKKGDNSNVTIVLLQEVNFDKLFDGFTNPLFSQKNNKDDNGFNNKFLIFDDNICGFWSPNVGMSGPKGGIREPKIVEHGTLVIWNKDIFMLDKLITPEYKKTSCVHGGSEIGIRSTHFVMLLNRNTYKNFMVMSVHANGGSNNNKKRKILLESIFDEVANYQIPIIIAGDFNTRRNDFMEIMKKYQGNLNIAVDLNTDKFTHIDTTNNDPNTNKWYIDYVVSNRKLSMPKISGDFGNDFGKNNDHKQVKSIINLF